MVAPGVSSSRLLGRTSPPFSFLPRNRPPWGLRRRISLFFGRRSSPPSFLQYAQGLLSYPLSFCRQIPATSFSHQMPVLMLVPPFFRPPTSFCGPDLGSVTPRSLTLDANSRQCVFFSFRSLFFTSSHPCGESTPGNPNRSIFNYQRVAFLSPFSLIPPSLLGFPHLGQKNAVSPGPRPPDRPVRPPALFRFLEDFLSFLSCPFFWLLLPLSNIGWTLF